MIKTTFNEMRVLAGLQPLKEAERSPVGEGDWPSMTDMVDEVGKLRSYLNKRQLEVNAFMRSKGDDLAPKHKKSAEAWLEAAKKAWKALGDLEEAMGDVEDSV